MLILKEEKLNKIIAQPSSSQSIALRARIILLAKQGAGIKAIAENQGNGATAT